MKKISIITLIILLGILSYYFIVGSNQIIKELKRELNIELELLQKNGFVVEDRVETKSSDYFVIHNKNTLAIYNYLHKKNINIDRDSAKLFIGAKIAFNIEYMSSIVSAVSVDIYPKAIPTQILRGMSQKNQDRVESMIEEKLFLAHLDINRLFTAFNGYIKDINITLVGEQKIKLVSSSSKFKGKYNHEYVTDLSCSIENYEMQNSSWSIQLQKLKSSYEAKKDSYNSIHFIEKIFLKSSLASQLRLEAISLESNESKSIDSKFGFNIKKAEVLDITTGKFIDGFNSKGLVIIDRNITSMQIQNNPFVFLNLMDAKAYLELSTPFYDLLVKRPEFMMAMVFIRPISKDGNKIFNIEYKKGSLTINNKIFLK